MHGPTSSDIIVASDDSENRIRCLVWDLDETLWNGTLLENDEVVLRSSVLHVLQTLDARGILQSIASKNDPQHAWQKLEQLGVSDYFLYPQIHWSAKSTSLRTISESLNIGLDSIAFIDDQPFEREEVAFGLPQVLCLDVTELETLLERKAFQPPFITEDARQRRQLYRFDMARKVAQDAFVGPQEAFLASLGMIFTLSDATEDDLQRAEELTIRTHQLNTTGQTYSYEELDALRRSDRHLLLIAELEDRFGPYGKIGLALVGCDEEAWLIKLLLMSCRVMGRGVGTIMLHHIMQMALDRGRPVHAEFRPNGRNDMMLATYRFAGFRETRRDGELQVLEARSLRVPPPPGYVQLQLRGRAQRCLPG
jgi:FkbH-like protein